MNTLEQFIKQKEEYLEQHPHLKQIQDKIDKELSKETTVENRLITLAKISKEFRSKLNLPSYVKRIVD